MVIMRLVHDLDADPDLLRTFLSVRRHGSLTRAAEELFLSQPAVSRRVARLERSLGLALFERLGRTLHSTDAGDALAAEASVFLGAAGRLAELVRARRGGEEGRLRVGASTTPGLYVLPEVVLAFRARFPKVEVEFAVENSVRIEERLLRNELDLGFVGAQPTHAAVSLSAVARDEIVCYAAADHPLAKRTEIAPRELEGELCIAREPGSATRRLVDEWLRRRRVRLRRTMEVGCPEAARVLVRAGLGFAYMSTAGLRGENARGLVRLPVADMRIRRPIHLVRHADKRTTGPMTAFVEASTKAFAGAWRI
jgi:DNA-binding transcriptional LysR family regulator